ncbi:hypothetical protein [Nitrobacter sp.]|uniref:hypothetical protein n=1 Tax=Nitrobacter sp. TaxID=29420 RepID=UPI001E05F1E1|nr:hypothetical protein [Nitrobacter sp.]MCB1392872.1 hypothetical protein [Nitrobacter sp.]
MRKRKSPFADLGSVLPELEAELFTFPQSRHDDQVDSITQALAHEISGYDTSMRWARHL